MSVFGRNVGIGNCRVSLCRKALPYVPATVRCFHLFRRAYDLPSDGGNSLGGLFDNERGRQYGRPYSGASSGGQLHLARGTPVPAAACARGGLGLRKNTRTLKRVCVDGDEKNWGLRFRRDACARA